MCTPALLSGKFHGQRNLVGTDHGEAKSQTELSTHRSARAHTHTHTHTHSGMDPAMGESRLSGEKKKRKRTKSIKKKKQIS